MRLNSNFPNPFNSQTSISFMLAEPAFVKLTIYNIMGQVIDELPSAHYGTREQRIIWNAGDLPSGVYLYEISSTDSRLIGRMTLIK
jgi:hypothetical protein